MPVCRLHGTTYKRVQFRGAIPPLAFADYTMVFDAYGSRMSALALVSNDSGHAWRKEFEASAGFPTG